MDLGTAPRATWPVSHAAARWRTELVVPPSSNRPPRDPCPSADLRESQPLLEQATYPANLIRRIHRPDAAGGTRTHKPFRTMAFEAISFTQFRHRRGLTKYRTHGAPSSSRPP